MTRIGLTSRKRRFGIPVTTPASRPSCHPVELALAFFAERPLNSRMTEKPMQETDQKPVPPTKAVAIDGTRTEGGPPRIVAKGRGFAAERILDIAFAEGVKVRQDKELTDILERFEVESPIPLEALHAVSLILERVYRENLKQAGNPPTDPPTDPTTGPPLGSAPAASVILPPRKP